MNPFCFVYFNKDDAQWIQYLAVYTLKQYISHRGHFQKKTFTCDTFRTFYFCFSRILLFFY